MKSVWFRTVLPVCLLAAIVFICFGRSLSGYFLADDFPEVSYISRIFQGDYKLLLADFTGNHMQTSVMKVYRPGATLALLFNYVIWRTAAWGYFLVNILFMLACALMLYLLLRELTRSWESKRSVLFALLSAALFAANPLHCEPVSFISSGDYLVSCFFCLLALWCFVKNAGAVGGKFFVWGVAAFWAAVLCKEAAVGLAAALFGIAFFLPSVFSHLVWWQATGKLTPSIHKNTGQIGIAVHTEHVGQHGITAAHPAQTALMYYSFTTRLRCAVIVSAPLWISTVAYLALRLILLGTITGGYTAGLGSSLMSSTVQRLTNPDTIFRIVFPLNASVFGATSIYGSILAVVYAVVMTCVLIKLVMKCISWEWLGLLAVWAFSATAPLYQVWSLGADLQGGRFFFFLTIPLSILLPAMLLAPVQTSTPDMHDENSNVPDAFAVHGSVSNLKTSFSIGKNETRAIDTVAVVALFALVLIDIAITYNNNIPWVHAGRQTKACVIQGQKLAQSVPAGKKVVLLGLPQELNGAHVIYNGSTFNIMMSPPFSQQNCTDKFITFDPLFYGSPSYVNAQRLKNVLLDPSVVGLYSWNVHRLCFEPLQKPSAEELLTSQQLNQNAICLSDGQVVSSLNLNPYKYDFIEITVKSQFSKLSVSLYWEGSGEKAFEWCDSKHPVQGMLSTDLGEHHNHADAVVAGKQVEKQPAQGIGSVRLRVSDHWQWYTQGNISKLRLEAFPGQTFELLSVRAVPGRLVMPVVAVSGLQANDLGVYWLNRSTSESNRAGVARKVGITSTPTHSIAPVMYSVAPMPAPGVDLSFDGSEVAGCVAIKIEVSKPNYFFEGLTPPEDSAAVMTSFTVSAKKGHVHIPANIFRSPGYYQLRAVCLNSTGSPIGEPSDPVTLGL